MDASKQEPAPEQFVLRVISQTESGLIKWVNITKGDIKWTRLAGLVTTSGRVEVSTEEDQ